jgi:hypothetical protein
VCTTISANDPPQKVRSTIFAPPQVEHRGATEPHILPKAYLADAQQNNPSDSGSGHVYQTGAGPEDEEFSCSHGTFLHVAPYVAQSHSAITPPPPHSLHITGPAQLPRVDKPHPTSVAGTRPAVAGCTRKEVAQVVLNGSSVSNKYDCKFSQDTLNGDIVENRFPVIELVYNLRANRFKPT